MTVPKMLTIAEAARHTGLAAYHIRQLCLKNKIVYITTGKKYLINLDKLIEYLNAGETAQGDRHNKKIGLVKTWKS